MVCCNIVFGINNVEKSSSFYAIVYTDFNLLVLGIEF